MRNQTGSVRGGGLNSHDETPETLSYDPFRALGIESNEYRQILKKIAAEGPSTSPMSGVDSQVSRDEFRMPGDLSWSHL